MIDHILQSITLVIIDDSESDRLTYSRYLQSDTEKTYRIIEAETLEEGLELWRSQQPDIVLIDLNLPDGDGLEFLEAINIDHAGERVPVIMLTGQGNEKMAVNAMKLGADDYLVKGDITAKSLTTRVKQVLRETLLSQQLQRSQQQQRLISEIALRIREFTNLDDIANAVVREVRQFIKADRAAIYQFNPDMSGTIVAEDILSPWQPCLNVQVQDTCFRENLGGAYCEGKFFVVNDIYTANLQDCYLQLLERFQVRANLVMPILLPDNDKTLLWGLLIMHQCAAPRVWEDSDIQLVQQLSVQLAISIKQVIAYQKIQNELVERKRVEALLLDQQQELENRNNLLETTRQELQQLNQSLEEKVRKRTQELWQVNQLQRAILDGTDYAIISTDLNGIIQTFNAGAEQIWGYSMGEVVGMVTPAIFHDAQELSDKTAKYSKILGKDIGVGFEALKNMAIEGLFDEEWIHIRKDGSRFPVSVSVTVLRDNNGQIIGSLGVIKDISDRKQAELQLQNTTERLTLALKSGAIGCWEWNLLDNTLNFDDRVYELYGLPVGTMVSFDAWANLVHPDDLQYLQALIGQAISETGEMGAEFRVIYPDQSIHYLKGYGIVIRDIDGNPQKITGVTFDISDRKQAELELQKTTERLALALKSGAIGSWEWDLKTNILFWDERMYEIYGVEKQSDPNLHLGIWLMNQLHPEDRSSVESFIQIAITEGKDYDDEFRVIHPDGSIHFIKAYGTFRRDAQGKPERMIGINFDISDRKLAEEALRESDQRWKFALEGAGDGVWDWDVKNNEVFYSPQWKAQLGYADAEIENRFEVWESLVHPDDLAQCYENINKCLNSEVFLYENEHRLRCKDGSYKWILARGRVLEWDANGHALRAMGTHTDLSDRKQAEQIIRQQANRETLLRGITQRIRQSLDLPVIFDIACQEIQQLLQCDRVGIFKFYPESNFNDGEFVAESVVDGFSSAMEVPIHDHCFGENYAAAYVQGRIQVVNDIDNAGLTDCHRDILAQFQVRANLVIPLLCGNNLWGLLCIHQCAHTRQWQEYEINLIQQIANQLAIAIQQANLFEQSQQEIAERKQAQRQLTETNQQLARATRLKDEFLANMSHELRTPLNSILGMNEALQDEVFGRINERQLKSLRTIENSSTHLLALINDILDVAKIESGQLTLELTATDLDSLCKSSLAFVKQQALTKQIQLIPRIPKYLPEIMLDERRIRQVLINLLNNAVKFTLEGGTITLEVSQVQLESSPTNLTPLNYIKIAVIDTGIGISAENIQKLFQPFIQIDSALNRKHDGTGLGLALVKRLVELHGGNVELTSAVGVGSCFAINLPINIGSPLIKDQTEQDLSGQSQIGQSQTEGLISPLILLAEDNEANIATFTSYLEAKGYRILLATDGQQAIDLAKTEHPDLILMDIQMPVIDGMEVIKLIRLDPNLADISIIALTALAMEGDRERCLAAGANEYLAKPIKLKHLNTTIQQFL